MPDSWQYVSDEQSQRVRSVAAKFDCDLETAQRYLDLKEEGYTTYEAKVMSGLSNPDYCEE